MSRLLNSVRVIIVSRDQLFRFRLMFHCLSVTPLRVTPGLAKPPSRLSREWNLLRNMFSRLVPSSISGTVVDRGLRLEDRKSSWEVEALAAGCGLEVVFRCLGLSRSELLELVFSVRLGGLGNREGTPTPGGPPPVSGHES